LAVTDREITGEKVMFAFIVMAAGGRRDVTPESLAKTTTTLMSDCIAGLLQDESGAARKEMTDKLRSLWAVHEEHSEARHPWDH
jgi:hypothetical protein